MDGFLHKYFLNNPGKRIHKWIHYFDIYERHFSRFRNKNPVMIEIGVMGGGSIEMWKEYFGSGCKIIGIDINPECKIHESEGIEVIIGSQDDPLTIEKISSKYQKIDIVLDDGSHIMNHMISTFNMLYEKVDANGVYMIEDTHTCYWEEYNGGLKRPGSFIEFAKDQIDSINATHTRGILPPSSTTKNTDYISFYDSAVVFEKRPQGIRQAPATQGMGR